MWLGVKMGNLAIGRHARQSIPTKRSPSVTPLACLFNHAQLSLVSATQDDFRKKSPSIAEPITFISAARKLAGSGIGFAIRGICCFTA
jgi:hypothetical protein